LVTVTASVDPPPPPLLKAAICITQTAVAVVVAL
jgi:hypothetical protein